MRILLLPCTLTWRNMGDVAMMQAAVRRLKASWPEAVIHIPTRNQEGLSCYCPETLPLEYNEWFSDHFLLGRFHKVSPSWLSNAAVSCKQAIRRIWPEMEAALVRRKLRSKDTARKAFESFIDTIHAADMVLLAGAGGINDEFHSWGIFVLTLLQLGQRNGRLTGIVSHGLGPLRSEMLFRRAKRVLTRLDLVGLRERLTGPAILEAMGVPQDRIHITGDDAIAMAYSAKRPGFGDAVGLNLRVGMSSGVDPEIIPALRALFQAFSMRHAAPLLPAPIALQQEVDARNIRGLLAGYDDTSDGGQHLDSPSKLIEQIGKCRIVVTGAYHAAVFALSQGIPAVCLVGSSYFSAKHRGLADMFGGGCEVVSIDHPGFEQRISEAMERLWVQADDLRPSLLTSAKCQMEAAERAYTRLDELARRRGLYRPRPVMSEIRA